MRRRAGGDGGGGTAVRSGRRWGSRQWPERRRDERRRDQWQRGERQRGERRWGEWRRQAAICRWVDGGMNGGVDEWVGGWVGRQIETGGALRGELEPLPRRAPSPTVEGEHRSDIPGA